MKVLLLLNGPEGWQTGIEDGFSYLQSIGEISDLHWLYLHHYCSQMGVDNGLEHALSLAGDFSPDIIVVFHVGSLPVSSDFIFNIKNIRSNPVLIYDEGDMYGSWAKPITKSMKTVIRLADVVSIRGLGKFYNEILLLNKNVIYTPHHADIARFDNEPYILENRKNKIVLIGNKSKPKYLSWMRRLPGARSREVFVKRMGKEFPEDFLLYGAGWGNFIGHQGRVDFQKQLDIYRQSWVTVAYEHYPEIPFYFSNRLPLALLAGSLYVCHYHNGYEEIFKGCDFIFFFRTNSEAIDLIKYIHSMSKEELLARSRRARKFALQHYHPNVVWRNFLNNSISLLNNADRKDF